MEKKQENHLSITLKRNATIKAVVTEEFKKYLVFELQEQLKSINSRIKQFEFEFEEYKKKMTGKEDEVARLKAQSEIEIVRLKEQINDIEQRINQVNALGLGTLFNQGTVEGTVNVKVGDNLYYKLGALEIIVKDGIIEKINPIGDQFKVKK